MLTPVASAQTPTTETDWRTQMARDPNNPKPYIELARIYTEQQRYADAIRMLQTAIGVLQQASVLPRLQPSVSAPPRLISRRTRARTNSCRFVRPTRGPTRPRPRAGCSRASARTEGPVRERDVRDGRQPGEVGVVVQHRGARPDSDRGDQAVEL